MSGATGAGSAAAGASAGAGANGARGSATDSQGVAVTDTRGQQPSYETYSGPLPGERAGAQQSGGPYHPPQAYGAPAPGGQAGGTLGGQTGAGAVRRPRTGASTTPRTRKARLRVAKADPWSVMKVSFLLSIALGICTVVAAAVLWMVMDAMGVFSTVGGTISEATGSNESNGFDLQSFLSLPRVLMFTSVIAVIDVVLMTALATLGAFIYNLSAGFVGGVELTLAEDE
ncbi:membrane protein [Streptomyces narbonensis]